MDTAEEIADDVGGYADDGEVSAEVLDTVGA